MYKNKIHETSKHIIFLNIVILLNMVIVAKYIKHVKHETL